MCTLLVIFSVSIHGISAVNYDIVVAAPQHPGSIKFQKVIGGIPFTKQLMGQINNYLWSTILKQNTPADRKPVDVVKVALSDFKGGEAVTVGTLINVSLVYLNDYNGPLDLKKEFMSLLHHEMTHCFQWNGANTAPVTVVEGIADYTILKANLYPPGFMPRGAGDRWDKGYDYTAPFFEYCDTLVPDFVAKLNNMMRTHYDVSFIKTITGKPVEQLWMDYKAKYPGVNK
ncbi:uncharacterized protein LOC143624635 [Bidens hawaiensis]|uniref:uncharacterized protein LOC143624635 n=1 Tax=Bidens hawaiensis TaxID=980011 RepID=UPI00404AB12E